MLLWFKHAYNKVLNKKPCFFPLRKQRYLQNFSRPPLRLKHELPTWGDNAHWCYHGHVAKRSSKASSSWAIFLRQSEGALQNSQPQASKQKKGGDERCLWLGVVQRGIWPTTARRPGGMSLPLAEAVEERRDGSQEILADNPGWQLLF
jgi:hypothetical protein